MSVTSGFYNSLNGDRRYNAEQMSALFDTLINDGVLANVGSAFAVNASTGMKISVGVGRAWFNSTWLYNDAPLSITLDAPEVLLDRYDAVVLEINHNESVRAGSIKVIKGTPASSPQIPAMTEETEVHQYPLAYIYLKAGSSEITQADITNKIGTSDCPYVTGILQVQSIDKNVAQWMDEWDQLVDAKEEEFNVWFDAIKSALEGDIATQLASRILSLEDGTTPAGDAKNLGGKAADDWQGAIDNIQTTSVATLSTTGWYRVATYTGSWSAAHANSCALTIKKSYNTENRSEYHDLRLSSVYVDNQKIYSVDSRVSSDSAYPQAITKARYTRVNDTHESYLEIYYKGASSSDCMFIVSNAVDSSAHWQAITPTLTSETVDGVTVTTTYDIPANASTATSVDLIQINLGMLRLNETALDTLAKDYSIADGRTYTATINPSGVSSDGKYVMGGMSFTVIGMQYGSRKFGYQMAMSCPDSTAKIKMRKIYDGTWGEWETLATTANLADYLPLSGGTISRDTLRPLIIKNAELNKTYIRYDGVDGVLGFLGFESANTPTVLTRNGDVAGTLLHTGNYTTTVTPANIGAAASSHNHAASNITSGTLAVARGGTGVTSNPSMLTNLGSTSAASVFAASPRPGVTGTLPIANGGTGATSASAALTKLGTVAVTISSSQPSSGLWVVP